MIDVNKVKPGDIIYTNYDSYEDLDGAIDPPINIGKISIKVKEITCWGDTNKLGILAEGQCWYPVERLTDIEPKIYQDFGRRF